MTCMQTAADGCLQSTVHAVLQEQMTQHSTAGVAQVCELQQHSVFCSVSSDWSALSHAASIVTVDTQVLVTLLPSPT